MVGDGVVLHCLLLTGKGEKNLVVEDWLLLIAIEDRGVGGIGR
jgi:hypothetical protein